VDGTLADRRWEEPAARSTQAGIIPTGNGMKGERERGERDFGQGKRHQNKGRGKIRLRRTVESKDRLLARCVSPWGKEVRQGL